ncbi:hypothetical protein [Calothrix rhizosoleniae]|uniref:hypothetical protein n=1 Tax=Calothrix rhizosoleniae TaxID=888997 RepID=UPI000B4A4774|nr:hypothetical protein [Calothrix rhizosoleniae]
MHEKHKSDYPNYNSIPPSQLSGLNEGIEEGQNSSFFLDLKPLVSTIYKSHPLPLSLVILIIPIMFGSGFIIKNDKNILKTPKLQNEKLTVQTPNFTRAEYERLKLGMLLVEVEAILGRGYEIEKTTKNVTFVWNNPDKSTITGIFEDGKLVRKKQEGL